MKGVPIHSPPVVVLSRWKEETDQTRPDRQPDSQTDTPDRQRQTEQTEPARQPDRRMDGPPAASDGRPSGSSLRRKGGGEFMGPMIRDSRL